MNLKSNLNKTNKNLKGMKQLFKTTGNQRIKNVIVKLEKTNGGNQLLIQGSLVREYHNSFERGWYYDGELIVLCDKFFIDADILKRFGFDKKIKSNKTEHPFDLCELIHNAGKSTASVIKDIITHTMKNNLIMEYSEVVYPKNIENVIFVKQSNVQRFNKFKIDTPIEKRLADFGIEVLLDKTIREYINNEFPAMEINKGTVYSEIISTLYKISLYSMPEYVDIDHIMEVVGIIYENDKFNNAYNEIIKRYM